MPVTTSLPYGIRDIRITPYTDAAGTTLASTGIDLPNARTLSFTETEDFNQLRGDDKVVATHGSGPTVEFEFEAGGFSFEAYQAMAGGTIATTGTGATTKTTYSKGGADARPYFKAEGQAISDAGGDIHCVLYKCKCTDDLTGEFSDGDFFLTNAKGIGIPDANNKLYDFVYNATAVAPTP